MDPLYDFRSTGRQARYVSFTAIFLLVLSGCAAKPGAHLEQRRTEVESKIEAADLSANPAIDAARSELEAAIAREGADVGIDGFELRAGVVHENDEKAEMLARVPLPNPFELRAQRKAQRAVSGVALARLEEVTLAQRVAGCYPSLERLVRAEHEKIYEGYERRYRALLKWNREMREAGRIDEVGARQFELAGSVRLTTRDPDGLVSPVSFLDSGEMLDVLPAPVSGAAELRTDPNLVREQLARHHPSVGVHRERRKQYDALAERESAKRIPSPRFVDFGFEPVAYSGDDRQIGARIAFDIPFGREASANTRRYEALSRAQRSEELAFVEVHQRDALVALAEINAFQDRSNELIALSRLANDSELLADRWWRNRLADPNEISTLLESVYDARIGVLAARDRAGRAGCAVIEVTGVPISQWPRTDSTPTP